MDVCVSLIISIFTGLLVWFITIKISNRIHKNHVRSLLSLQYKFFRQKIIQLFIEAEGASLSEKDIANLCNCVLLLSARYTPNSNAYSNVQNNISTNQYLRQKFSKHLSEFATIIMQTISTSDILDEKEQQYLMSKASILSSQAFEIERTGKVDNPIDIVFSILVHEDLLTGKLDKDPIEEAIKHL